MKTKYFIKNIVNHDRTLHDCSILVDDGMILEIKAAKCPKNELCYDYAIPGFIDIHTHGADGCELMDNDSYAMGKISEFYLRHGTTAYLSSTVTDFLDKTGMVLDTASKFIKENLKLSNQGKQASCLGVHMEGPWLSPNNIGAQNPECCIIPDSCSFALIDKYRDIIKMVTFSYHTPESGQLLQFLVDRSIVPACGHDEAVDEQMIVGFESGVQLMTHIYCVSSGFQRKNGVKHLGSLEMALMTDGVKVEVISDGKHITKFIWDFIKHNKSFDDIIIISDSMRCAGLPENPDKVYKLGDVDVIVDQGVAWLADKTLFAGSVATMYSNFMRLVCQWNVTVNDAVKITSYNQAKLLKCDNLGEIEIGKKADILLLNSDYGISKIIKSGVELQ